MESPVVLAPTENDPLFVPDAAELPLIVNQEMEEVAVQLSVPEPPFVTLTVWAKGFVPPCTAEKEREAGFRPMTGLKAVGETGDVGVVPVGVSSWVSPGIAVDSCWMLRPVVILSWVEGAGAATADNGKALGEVPAEGAGLTMAPNDSDVAGAVVTDVVFAGATVLVVVGLSTLESLLCV